MGAPRANASADVHVVHRDAHLLVVCKPVGMPTTSPDGKRCLVAAARELDPDAPRMHPSSRLDAEVSGLVTFARTRHAIRALTLARERGAYRRMYVALAAGPPEPEVGCWSSAIAVDPRDARRRVVARTRAQRLSARSAMTSYRIEARAPGGVCLLLVEPRTGRTHQIRVHSASASAPLLGDVHYGGPRRLTRPDGHVVTARRVMLHCAGLLIPDVEGGGQLDLRAPAPEDLRTVWVALGGDASLACLGDGDLGLFFDVS